MIKSYYVSVYKHKRGNLKKSDVITFYCWDLITSHQITDCAELEGTHKTHGAQLLALNRTTPESLRKALVELKYVCDEIGDP